MNIGGVNAYRSALQLPPVAPSAPSEATGGGFGGELTKAVESMGAAQRNADDAILKLASGQPIELHDAMLAMEEAQLGLQLFMQVRTKVVEAYQEVMRTQL